MRRRRVKMEYRPLSFAALTGRSGHGLAPRFAKLLTSSGLVARPLAQ